MKGWGINLSIILHIDGEFSNLPKGLYPKLRDRDHGFYVILIGVWQGRGMGNMQLGHLCRYIRNTGEQDDEQVARSICKS